MISISIEFAKLFGLLKKNPTGLCELIGFINADVKAKNDQRIKEVKEKIINLIKREIEGWVLSI